MTIWSLADGCRQLSIDPKTLRRWLATAPFTLQPHPHKTRRKGLTDEQSAPAGHRPSSQPHPAASGVTPAYS